MEINSLARKNCGAPLQIKEEVDQLACVHCGAQMYIDRAGGAIPLQLVEALGSIRTGAVRTAAELALVRLEKEREKAPSRVRYLEGEAQREATYPVPSLSSLKEISCLLLQCVLSAGQG